MSNCPNCGAKLPENMTSNTVKIEDPNVSPKNRLLAMLLGIFCGSVGVHNFYLGQKKRGMVKAILMGVAITLCYIGYFCLILGISLSEADILDSEALLIVMTLLYFIIFFIALGMIYYCVISALVEWIKIARGFGYDGNGLPVKNWNC